MKRESHIKNPSLWGLVLSLSLHAFVVGLLNLMDEEKLFSEKLKPDLIEVSYTFELPEEADPQKKEEKTTSPIVEKKKERPRLQTKKKEPKIEVKVAEKVPIPQTNFPKAKPKNLPNPSEASTNKSKKPEPKKEKKDWANLNLDPSSISFKNIQFQNPDGTQIDQGPIPSVKKLDKEEQEKRIRENISRSLYADANRKNYARRKESPKLKPKGDGGFSFKGDLFSARIYPDGSVSFSDRELSLDPIFGEEKPPNARLTLRFDATAAIEKSKGTDPLYAERYWFMKQTEEVREKLAAQYVKKQLERSIQRLRANLVRIWKSGKLNDVEKRKKIFLLWDECGDDDVGRKAQEAIVYFIRRNAPVSSSVAFTKEEIAGFNQKKNSLNTFAPYAKSKANM